MLGKIDMSGKLCLPVIPLNQVSCVRSMYLTRTIQSSHQVHTKFMLMSHFKSLFLMSG